jgi:CHASE2 domain-containing sensor protein
MVIAAAILGHFAIKYFEFLRYIEERNFDRWIVWHTQPAPKDLALVEISDESYFEHFGRGRLDQGKVQELIEAVARGGAKVIGVDIDTRDWDPAKLARLEHLGSVVWADMPLGTYRENHDGPWRKARELQRLRGCVLVERSNLFGVIRTMPERSLATAMLTQKPSPCQEHEQEVGHAEHDRPYIHFIHRSHDRQTGFRRTTVDTNYAHVILEESRRPRWNGSVFQGKYVLIGGTFADSGDRHLTPFDETAGLDIQADILATALEPEDEQLRPAKDPLVIAFDIAFGLALLAVLWRLHHRPLWTWFVLLIATPAAAVVLALTLFEGGLFMSFLPILLGMILHELGESVLEHRQTKRDLEKCRASLGVAN